MQKVTPHIYAETDYFTPNVGFIVTEEGAVLVDSPFLPRDARHWFGEINRVTDRGIAYLINTDHHFDHMLGNCFLTRNVITHRTARKGFEYYLASEKNLKKDIGMFWPQFLENWEKDFAHVEVVLPRIIFNDEMRLYLGGTEIQLMFVGGHSPATILIYVPGEGVLFAGDDIENDRHPAMTSARFGAWLDAVKRVERMDVEIIIPGHGAVGNKALATKQRLYIEEMMGYARRLKEEGRGREDVVRSTTDHMLSYLPVTYEDPAITRGHLLHGAKRLFDQID